MEENSKLVFYEKLTSLLQGEVTKKSDEAIKGELFCDWLKAEIRKLYEQSHRLDLFSDDFNFSEFLSNHIDYPLERLKIISEKNWLRDKLTIGLMGHFCTGKTTAVNLLFDEDFQTDRHENTAIATYLTYGNNHDIVTLVDRAGQSQVLTTEQSSILDYSSGVQDFPFARIFDYMVKENSNALLKEITIIDTPGLFTTSDGHSAPTMNVISSCDAILWFINITASLTEKDRNLIKDSLMGLPLYIVFSFTDARGTIPHEVDASINSIINELKKDGIECKGFMKLGKREDTKHRFKEDAIAILKKLAKDNEVYEPENHILAAIGFLEDFLVKYQAHYQEEFGKLDSETDDLLAVYRSSSRTFVSECNSCINRFGSMIDTFNNRCAGATFCAGASGAIRNNLSNVQSSFNKMIDAYNNMDEQKLIEFGNGAARMSYIKYHLDSISEILDGVKKLKAELQ